MEGGTNRLPSLERTGPFWNTHPLLTTTFGTPPYPPLIFHNDGYINYNLNSLRVIVGILQTGGRGRVLPPPAHYLLEMGLKEGGVSEMVVKGVRRVLAARWGDPPWWGAGWQKAHPLR